MKNLFEKLSKEQRKKVERYIFIGATLLSALMIVLLLFVPFGAYESHATGRIVEKKLRAVNAFTLLKNKTFRTNGLAYLDLGVFIFVAVCILIAAVLLIKGVFAAFHNGAAWAKSAKRLLSFSTCITAFFSFAGMIVCMILGEDSMLQTTFNFYPTLILLVADVAYAMIAGLRK